MGGRGGDCSDEVRFVDCTLCVNVLTKQLKNCFPDSCQKVRNKIETELLPMAIWSLKNFTGKCKVALSSLIQLSFQCFLVGGVHLISVRLL